ncbi:uncharacterized protein LOC144645277 [Oculina patagonica]
MARSSIKVASEYDVTPPAEGTLDFDDDNLRAIAEVYKNQGNEEYRKRDFINAIHFYTEGIKVNCKDDELKAQLYSNRAIANFKLGNHLDSLSDAKAATDLQPIFLKAIVRGASACVELKQFEEAITWCDKGLAIDKNNKTLLGLKARSVNELKKIPESHIFKITDEDTKDVTKTAQKNAANESEVKAYVDKASECDEDNLREKAEIFKNKGNYEYSKKNLSNAIHFYTEGIKVNCKDDELNAKLYSNRAIAHLHLGNYEKSLRDARAATDLQPTFLKAIERGASACIKLNRFGEAITWCDKGLAIDTSNKKLLELRIRSVKEQSKQQEPDVENTETNLETHIVKGKVGDFKCPNAKRVGYKAEEALFYGNLGNTFLSLGDFRKATNYYELCLKIAKEVGEKAIEGKACGSLGSAFLRLGDFRKAIDYCELHLKIAREVGDKVGEGKTCGNLGSAFLSVGDFRKAIEYYELDLIIAKGVGDKAGEGGAYGNLGNAFRHLGDFRKAIDYFKLCLKIAKEVSDKACEEKSYGNLGNAFLHLGDFRKAIDYYESSLKIAKEVGDKAGEGEAYCGLGNANKHLGDVRKAIDYCELHLKIAKEVGDKVGEGYAYGNLGNAFLILGDLRKAIDYHESLLKIAKEVGDKNAEAKAYHLLGLSFESQGFLPKALEYNERSVRLYNHVRNLLQSKDEWKIGYRNEVDTAYTGLWRVLLKQGMVVEALFAAEKGRAQNLTDLMLSQFGIKERQSVSQEEEEQYLKLKRSIPSSTVFQAFDNVTSEMNLWALSKDEPVRLGQKEVGEGSPFLQSLIHNTYRQIGVRSEVICENRSMDALRANLYKANEKRDEENSQPFFQQESSLSTLYNILIQPIADLIQGDELIIVPDGPLWLAPYAALVDADSKYLCDSFRIRLIPSLTSLRLIADCPDDYHSRSGALLVGDPWVEEVTNWKGEKFLDPLPFARKEVKMIGKILNVTPLIGKKATKREVLKGLSSVALVHIAAHGCMETGEIALTPDAKQAPRIPTKEEDYILKMSDVLSVKVRARLVVLSCCHSGRGEIKAEGVVGIARAFMGAGARSVLVSLWAIDDEATMEFMRSFYHHLVDGRSASESLNQAMKDLRESDKYSYLKYWAPFVLIGDDVTLDFSQKQ